jgi:Ca-activated chloride channel family protein
VNFGEPLWFWAFALLPVLIAIFAANERRREKLVRQLVAARLQDRLAGTVSIGRRRLRFSLLLLALACLIVALARPQYGFTWEESKRKGRDVLIAIDCSRSMLATDLAPSRLGRAKLAAQDFIAQLTGDRVGLIAFAGSAFLQAPLTVDYGAVMTSLNELDTSIIPRGGTNIAAAIKEAEEAFGKGEGESRCLVIFTDGEELDADGINAAAAQKDKIKIFTVGLGSTDGSLIPIPGQSGGTDFVKDDQGQIVKSRLDEDRLRKIAEATGGFYLHLQSGPAEMQKIVREGLGQMKEQEIDARMSRRPIERYQWPLAAGLAFLFASTLLSERKRRASRAALMSVVVMMSSSVASAAQSPWKNPGVEQYARGTAAAKVYGKAEFGSPEQEAARQAARDGFEGAYETFAQQLKRQPNSPEHNFNLGVAAYRLEKNDEALQLFGKALLSQSPEVQRDSEGYLGNTLWRAGEKQASKEGKLRDWKGGIAHYDAALQISPGHDPIQKYRDALQRKIENLEKEPPQQDQQQQKDQKKDEQKKDDEKKDNQDQKQQQQSQDKPQEKQEKQDQQNQSKDQQQSQKDQSQEKSEQSQKSEGDEQKDQSKQGESKPEAPKDQQDQSKPQQDKKDGRKDPNEPKDGNGQMDQKKQDQPAPSPEQSDQKREGEIKAQGDQPPPTDAQQEAAAEAQAAAEGRMTEAQAMNLLESLKGEDERVQLLKPNERRPSRFFRDW